VALAVAAARAAAQGWAAAAARADVAGPAARQARRGWARRDRRRRGDRRRQRRGRARRRERRHRTVAVAARRDGRRGGHGRRDQHLRSAILADGPVAYWAMNKFSGTETGSHRQQPHRHVSRRHHDARALPNGDQAADFNGSSQYVSVPSSAAFSIPTTHNLTWEAWIRPDVLQFPNDSSGYVDWMGKCQDYSPTCEWEARMYSTTTARTAATACRRTSSTRAPASAPPPTGSRPAA
jgi:hypothetical protein